MLDSYENASEKITFAQDSDIPCWMDLVRLVIDGFPHLREEDYLQVLKQSIADRQALILKDQDVQLRTSEHRSMYSYVRLSIDRCTATYV